ncbi:MAG: hypothetical protein AAGB04_00015 [Pseudomonadota bacterium]
MDSDNTDAENSKSKKNLKLQFLIIARWIMMIPGATLAACIVPFISEAIAVNFLMIGPGEVGIFFAVMILIWMSLISSAAFIGFGIKIAPNNHVLAARILGIMLGAIALFGIFQLFPERSPIVRWPLLVPPLAVSCFVILKAEKFNK